MIIYEQGLYGVVNLGRVHGSAAYKVVIPCLFSTGILLVVESINHRIGDGDSKHSIEHPYGIGAFVAFFSFLLTFRLNFGYQRYWEACTAVHQMMSKWLDAAMTLAAFHYQAANYRDMMPPAFGDSPQLSQESIKRRSGRQKLSQSKVKEDIQGYLQDLEQRSGQTVRGSWLTNLLESAHLIEKSDHSSTVGSNKIKKSPSDITIDRLDDTYHIKGNHLRSINSIGRNTAAAIPVPARFQAPVTRPRTSNDLRARLMESVASQGSRKLGKHLPPTPSLFLQEAAHLVSLLNAVALSTMRNDDEIAESPLNAYLPGSPWPPIDPDSLPTEVKQRYGDGNVFWRWTYFVLSISRSERMRTLYNAARPFGVLGGVSDQEIEILQRARGPSAKTSLCTMWLEEFITRESLNGSTGDVASPILSRLYQFVSDGMIGYHQARKIVYTPFPFVHAQISALFSLAIIGLFPALYYSYVNNLGLACVLNFLTTMCFLGMHEVARELEHPFQNVPNDLPVTTWQAQFNEALIAMYAGYNPDLFVETDLPMGSTE